MEQNLISSLLDTALLLMVPVLLPALGETIAELSGVFNIGTEGMILMGGITCYFVSLATGNIILGALMGLVTGAIMGLIVAYFQVTQGVDQVVFGLGVFLLGLSLSAFLNYTLGPVSPTGYVKIPTLQSIHIPFLSDLPHVGFIFSQNVLVYISIVLVFVTWFILDRTWLGLKIRTIGQDAAVADSLGLRVFRYRYACLMIAGVLSALGGCYLLIALTGIWIDNISGGRGFVAFALLRLGAWRPWAVGLAALAYGGITALQYVLQVVAKDVPSQLFQAIPYIFTIVVLALARDWIKQRQPRDLGIPYKRQ